MWEWYIPTSTPSAYVICARNMHAGKIGENLTVVDIELSWETRFCFIFKSLRSGTLWSLWFLGLFFFRVVPGDVFKMIQQWILTTTTGAEKDNMQLTQEVGACSKRIGMGAFILSFYFCMFRVESRGRSQCFYPFLSPWSWALGFPTFWQRKSWKNSFQSSSELLLIESERIQQSDMNQNFKQDHWTSMRNLATLYRFFPPTSSAKSLGNLNFFF